jgi:hypothetical protein
VETARQEVRRRKLLSFLESTEPAWEDKDHPELATGAEVWVRQLRHESEARGPGPSRPRLKPRATKRSRSR